MRVRGRHRLGFLLLSWTLAWTLACAGPGADEISDAPGSTTAGPLDRAEYAKRLGEAAGVPVSVDRLVEIAAGAADRIEGRMDRLVEAAGEPGGWRPHFEGLRLEAPADEEAVLEAYRAELERASSFVDDRQLFTSLPAAPEVVVLENPSLRAYFPLALYHDGRFAVTTESAEGDDPAYLMNHCRVCIPPLAVHEGIPGHHLAFARMNDAGGEGPSVAELARYKPFVEGWALYAEALMLESGYYEEIDGRLAAWRMVLLRLVRAEIDAGLNGGGLEPAAAEEIYRRRLLMTPAAAAAEVRSHLAKPTVKTSYFLGLLQILELRQLFRTANPDVPPADFHARLLGSPAPIPRIARKRFDIELGPPGEVDLPWPWSADEPSTPSWD